MLGTAPGRRGVESGEDAWREELIDSPSHPPSALALATPPPAPPFSPFLLSAASSHSSTPICPTIIPSPSSSSSLICARIALGVATICKEGADDDFFIPVVTSLFSPSDFSFLDFFFDSLAFFAFFASQLSSLMSSSSSSSSPCSSLFCISICIVFSLSVPSPDSELSVFVIETGEERSVSDECDAFNEGDIALVGALFCCFSFVRVS